MITYPKNFSLGKVKNRLNYKIVNGDKNTITLQNQ